jgi:hypothetical protein
LPKEVQKSINQIVANADTEALKVALLAILGFILMALLVSVFISPGIKGGGGGRTDVPLE